MKPEGWPRTSPNTMLSASSEGNSPMLPVTEADVERFAARTSGELVAIRWQVRALAVVVGGLTAAVLLLEVLR